ncbi:hypothetical protein HDC92_001824 [Pedobacter sp. AK017]|uniref:DUF6266 family protein n=1 Tax=Pedobacter sp. AK017 TaxID=2723073 RepID=UPI0016208283|nr:DUF6266 family protein [Pedobacter sp. AK017]MBB5438149.1 hypothetical protein [Pedobacter sp. AK017]
MAKLKNGIFGAISGKLGPLVGGIWNGIPYLRERPKQGEIKKARTSAQIANEAKFKFGNNWLVPFHPFVSVGFHNYAVGKTAIAAAFSANYLQVISGAYPNFVIDYPKVVISKGSLPQLKDPLLSLSDPDTLEISWLPNTGTHASYNDQLMLVLYSPELQIADGFIGYANRADEQYSFKFNPQLVGVSLEVYLSVVSLDRKKVADSIYMGRIAP